MSVGSRRKCSFLLCLLAHSGSDDAVDLLRFPALSGSTTGYALAMTRWGKGHPRDEKLVMYHSLFRAKPELFLVIF